jgi:hypothetical protein
MVNGSFDIGYYFLGHVRFADMDEVGAKTVFVRDGGTAETMGVVTLRWRDHVIEDFRCLIILAGFGKQDETISLVSPQVSLARPRSIDTSPEGSRRCTRRQPVDARHTFL